MFGLKTVSSGYENYVVGFNNPCLKCLIVFQNGLILNQIQSYNLSNEEWYNTGTSYSNTVGLNNLNIIWGNSKRSGTINQVTGIVGVTLLI